MFLERKLGENIDMTVEQYYSAVEALGLTQSKVVPTVFLDREGKPRNVKDPYLMNQEERAVFIRALHWTLTGEGSPPYA